MLLLPRVSARGALRFQRQGVFMSKHSFDEQPVRVGLLLLRAVELLQALGGLLEAQAHAVGRAIRTPSL